MPSVARLTAKFSTICRHMPKYDKLVWLERVTDHSVTIHMAGDLLTIELYGEPQTRAQRAHALAVEVQALITQWKTCQFSPGAHYEFLQCLHTIARKFMPEPGETSALV